MFSSHLSVCPSVCLYAGSIQRVDRGFAPDLVVYYLCSLVIGKGGSH